MAEYDLSETKPLPFLSRSGPFGRGWRICAAILALALSGSLPVLADAGDPLADGFANPPESAKPHTWWHWVDGNVSKEGITADLEAMKRIGLGGAQLFTVGQLPTKGPVPFTTPEWRSLVHFAFQEAERLHLEMGMEGCYGWSESGGSWIGPAESMQQVVWTEQQASGGQKVVLDLPQPKTVKGYYEDIALYAFPTVANDPPPAPAKITASDPAFDGATIGTPKAQIAAAAIDAPVWIQAEYVAPVTFRSAWIVTSPQRGVPLWDVQASDDGVTFRRIAQLGNEQGCAFPAATARFFRLWRTKNSVDGKPLVLRSLTFGGAALDYQDSRTGMARLTRANVFSPFDFAPGEVIDPKTVVDLTGRRDWDAPPGNWTLLRVGHTSTGAPNFTGLECDKLSPEAVTHHLEGMFGPVFADSPAQVGTTLHTVLLDSWEAGCENWTPHMAAEFKKRRGYDPMPWLPALSGKIVGSAELTERFLWDYRRTLADLLAEMHYGTIQEFAHRHHMILESEAPGIDTPAVADNLLCKKYTDIPMAEFWVSRDRKSNVDDPKEAATAAHLYGRPIAAAESYTSAPETAAWTNDPYSLKALGDYEFCLGINRFVFHRFVHQPWLDRAPGMCLGPWGINFERTNTWWEQGRAWIQYVTRCQYLLQQGRFQADLLYYYGEGVPANVHYVGLKPVPPPGYDYDDCNPDVLLNLVTVGPDGRLALPDGMAYRILVLPDTDRMTLPVLEKVRALVNGGATVYGPKPAKPPTMNGYPDADAKLAAMSDEVWGPCDGKAVKEHAYGKGKVVWGEPLTQILDVGADVSFPRGDLAWIHRRTDSADVYFLSNQGSDGITVAVTFRVTGRQPELWHPDTGEREAAALYQAGSDGTTVPLHFDPSGSVFVVFRRGAPASAPLVALQLDGKPIWNGAEEPPTGAPVVRDGHVEFAAFRSGSYQATTGDGKTLRAAVPVLPAAVGLAGSWQVRFPSKLGAPDSAVFNSLTSWSDSPDDGVKYFSGTATYLKDFSLPADLPAPRRRLYLDLGTVKNLAEVTLNGHALGILWKAPFRVDVTGAVKAGDNHLEVRVTNLWPNRLIGDSKLPPEQRITWASFQPYKPDSPLLPSGLLGPVTIVPAQVVSLSP